MKELGRYEIMCYKVIQICSAILAQLLSFKCSLPVNYSIYILM